METTHKEAYLYQTGSGRCPFEEWLDALKDLKGRAKIRTKIDRVLVGNLGRRESVGKGVLELKVDSGPGYRIYIGQVGQVGQEIVILLCAGDKITQDNDIRRAHDYWMDYWRRPYAARKALS